jgi:serine/threonine protein kinase
MRPFGKYQLRRRIGAGGMGVVYLAVDLALGRDVAIKTLPRVSPESSFRLRREARAMASITHPNAALIYAVEFYRGVPLLVLEYLSGGTVQDRLPALPYGAAETIDLGFALASALEAAHAVGILHRDIKPSNVGFSGKGTPKLLDFGLARLFASIQPTRSWSPSDSQVTLTSPVETDGRSLKTVGVVGTPAYLSPEAMVGLPPGPQFDLWGLAVLLVEALSGCNPFRGSSGDETMRRILDGERPSVRSLAVDCPTPLADFLEGCLDRDPRNRPQSARGFIFELGQVRVQLAP